VCRYFGSARRVTSHIPLDHAHSPASAVAAGEGKRELDYDKAVRQAEARRKVAAATGSADGEQDIGPQPPKPTQGSKVGAVEDDFGLPALDSEEDNQQRRSVLECLDLICCLSASPQGARKLHVAGAVPTVAKLMINRNACVREQVCVTIETVSSAASVAAALHRATSNGRDSSLNAASSEAAGGGGYMAPLRTNIARQPLTTWRARFLTQSIQ
jgi:hypothetical protein